MKPPELVDIEEPPQFTIYLFNLYREIKTVEPITFSEILSWTQLTEKQLVPFEIEAIRRLDSLYYKVQNDK